MSTLSLLLTSHLSFKAKPKCHLFGHTLISLIRTNRFLESIPAERDGHLSYFIFIACPTFQVVSSRAAGAMRFHLPTVLGIVPSMAGGSQPASLQISGCVCSDECLLMHINTDSSSSCLPQLHVPMLVALIWNYIHLCAGVLEHAFMLFGVHIASCPY